MTDRTVIIDTDPGLDDAIAILFALACGRFDVLGLTTVAGNIGLDRTTANAGNLVRLLGLETPVIMGATGPLQRIGINEAAIHGDDGLGGIVLPEAARPPLSDAVGWMVRHLHARPSQSIDFLALGPLTNLAHLIERHSQAAQRLRRVIAMGGAIAESGNVGPRSEFNFASDPEALAVVLGAGLDLTIVPLDVTRQVRADAAYLESLRGTPQGDVASTLLRAYVRAGRHSRPLHDPCVMLYALAPELFGTERMMVTVDLVADPGAIQPSPSGHPATVALTIDAPRALDLLQTAFA